MTPEQESAALARIARESEQRFGKGASKEKFAWRNAERARLGLGKEKRKRGGLGGVWDRNKGVIKQAVPAALSFIPGAGIPLAAGARAAMEGFDRPGKRGIGFDVGEGLKGGVKGALTGTLTRGVAGAAGIGSGGATGLAGAKAGVGAGLPTGLRNFFTPGQAPPGAATAAGNVASAVPGLGSSVGGSLSGQIPSVTQALGASQPAATGIKGILTGAGNFAKNNAAAVGMAAQGIGTAVGAGAERDVAIREQDFEERRYREEQEARQRLAQLLMPIIMQELEWRQQNQGFISQPGAV